MECSKLRRALGECIRPRVIIVAVHTYGRRTGKVVDRKPNSTWDCNSQFTINNPLAEHNELAEHSLIALYCYHDFQTIVNFDHVSNNFSIFIVM